MSKNVVLGDTGSIAAYRAADLCSAFRKEGIDVRVVMSRCARQFVGELTFTTLTQNPAITDENIGRLADRPEHLALGDFAAAEHEGLLLAEDHGIVIADRGEQQTLGVRRVRRADRLESWNPSRHSIQGLGVLGCGPRSGAIAMHQAASAYDDEAITGLSVKVRVEVEDRAKAEGWKVAYDVKTSKMTFTPKRKYGKRAERYVYIEAGHAGQNLLLQATALGLGSVIIGAFLDGLVKNVLGLEESEQPISLLPVGRRTE